MLSEVRESRLFIGIHFTFHLLGPPSLASDSRPLGCRGIRCFLNQLGYMTPVVRHKQALLGV